MARRTTPAWARRVHYARNGVGNVILFRADNIVSLKYAMLQVIAQGDRPFCAGIEIVDGRGARTNAPILHWLIGMSVMDIVDCCARRGWFVIKVMDWVETPLDSDLSNSQSADPRYNSTEKPPMNALSPLLPAGVQDFKLPKAEIMVLAEKMIPGTYVASSGTSAEAKKADNAQRVRHACQRAVNSLIRGQLVLLFESALNDRFEAHEMILGDRAETPDAALGIWDEQLGSRIAERFAPVLEFMDAAAFEAVAGGDVGYHEVGRFNDVAKVLASRVSHHYTDVGVENIGKLLSAAGIVGVDIAQLAKKANKIPMPAEPETEEQPELPLAAPTAVATAEAPAPAAEVPPAPPAPSASQTTVGAPVTKEELSKALVLWYRAGGADIASFAEKLGVSGATLRNWTKAEGAMPPKSPLSAAQIDWLIYDCATCITDLNSARAVFERAKAHAK